MRQGLFLSSDPPDDVLAFAVRAPEHIEQRRRSLMQPHVFALGGIVVILGRQRIVVVPMLLRFTMDCRLERRYGRRNLLDGEYTLRRGRLAGDVEQLACIGLEHDDICGGLGFESIEHIF